MAERRVDFEDHTFRNVMGHFCTGVVVITSTFAEQPVGFTCQSFVSVSISPPLVLFCPSRSSMSWPPIRQSGKFCVNVLDEKQIDLCNTFANSGGNKFEGVSWFYSESNLPTLDGCLAHIECEIEEVHPAGDHEVVLGRVDSLRVGEPGSPLLFYRGVFSNLMK